VETLQTIEFTRVY